MPPLTKTYKNTKPSKVKGFFIVQNNKGLHTRPSTELARCAGNFKAEVRLSHQSYEVNAKSLLGILMLAATKGTKIGVEAIGQDAQEAVDAIVALAQNNFNLNY